MLQQIAPSEIVATLRDSLLVLTEDLFVEYANDHFFETFEVAREETFGTAIAELGNGQWNIPSLIQALGGILDHGQTVHDIEVDHVFENIGRRVMLLNARKTVRPGNGSRRILLVIEDVTVKSDTAAELERERLLSTGIVDTISEPLLVLDERLGVITASRAFYTKFQVTEQATLGRRLDDLGNGQWAIPELLELLTHVIPESSVINDYEMCQDFPSIGRRTVLLNARKIYRAGNHTYMLLLTIQDITERRQLEAERQQALENANRLLEELNHRVMNSLAMIGGIISMEARNVSDVDAKAAFSRMRARLDAVGRLYKTLSRSGAVDHVDTRQYLTALAEDLVTSSGQIDYPNLEIDIDQAPISTRIAVPLGLIVNELITNSLKYAFDEKGDGRLRVTMKIDGSESRLMISDNGSGIDPAARVDSGLGQKLTAAFTTELNGKIATSSDETGTRHTLIFPTSTFQSSV
ncbi:Signal transduction histidine kinase (plasmid) [Phaeobacter piscinae]|nr:Signal transduction histidine kinase [Phaeobacter inhibens]AUQ80326.1 Signal transduction histidine kinase [Phaeobacter inhibens]AUR17485.1 Signal transduction histidine kinase [Phaeobacter inhibens]AUR37733.1 Signal transduction histidine kinase [Phaeobacter piscinae]